MAGDLKKIFVADDDPDILDILRMMLKTRGYAVEVSSNANELFEYRQEELPDLILLDIWMSGLDGRDICVKLKENDNTKNIPVLFISANSNIHTITKEYHADGYIAKPFDMNAFLNTVRETLEPVK